MLLQHFRSICLEMIFLNFIIMHMHHQPFVSFDYTDLDFTAYIGVEVNYINMIDDNIEIGIDSNDNGYLLD